MKTKAEGINTTFKKIITSRTVPEMLKNIPWGFTYFLLFVPLFLLMAIPLWQLAEDIIIPDGHPYSFYSNIHSIHTMAFYFSIIAVVIIISKSIVQKTIPENLFSSYLPLIFFGIVIALMLISTAVNGITDYVRYGDDYRGESLLTVIMYFLFYFLSASVIKKKKQKALLLYTYMTSSIAIAICMLIHSCIKPLEAFHFATGPAAIFHQFNHYGYFLLMNILISEVLFIKEEKIQLKIICMVSFILNNIVLVINDTFGCYLACFIALVFSVIVISICDKKFCKTSLVMIAVFIIISLVMSIWYETIFTNISIFFKDINKIAENSEESSSAGTGRWTLWTHTVDYIKERPWFGFGIEGTNTRLAADTKNINDRPHCEFLQYAVFYGIPAAAAYISGAFSVFLNGLKHRSKLDIYTIAALVAAFGYLVSSTFGNTMYYTAPHFFILLGLGFNLRKCDEN